MDALDEYKVQESLRDAIRILDSAPVKPDLASETVIVQLSNLVPIAHLAIERGLKALIKKSTGVKPRGHSLDCLYRKLRKCDTKSAKFLDEAFDDAVTFFRLDTSYKGFGHFQSLESYLSKVGGGRAFQALRYWPIEDIAEEGSLIPFILLPIHREILEALSCLFFNEDQRAVSFRVEDEVALKLNAKGSFPYIGDSKFRDECSDRYRDWLMMHRGALCNALREAVQRDFELKNGNEFASRTLRDAFEDLRQSKDPAVQYFVRTCSYLPKGSQRQNLDAIPAARWRERNDRATLTTAAGTVLGYIQRYPDGAWGIQPLESGWARVTAVCEDLIDAKHYLVNRLTTQVTVTVNGIPKQLRIVGKPRFSAGADWTSEEEDAMAEISGAKSLELEFWDNEHGLQPGDRVSVETPSDFGPDIKCLCEGSVKEVREHVVSILGSQTFV